MLRSVSIGAAIASGDPAVLAQWLIERLAPVVDDPATHPRDLNILCLRIQELSASTAVGRRIHLCQ